MTAKADEAQDTAAPETAEDESEGGGGHGGLTLDGLANKVDHLAEVVSNFAKGRPRAGSQADQSEAVASQVREEVGKIAADDKKKQAEADRIGTLERQVKAVVERAPREYRPITKLLWGDDDE
jgi:hypothetical protein